jgi:Tol biopolymer transport system component
VQVASAAVSDDGRYVAYIGFDGAGTRLQLRDRTTGTTRRLVSGASALERDSMSGDGNRVVYAFDHDLYLKDFGTGAATLTGSDEGSENVPPTAFTPGISPDGLRVAYQSGSHGIFIKDIPSGAVSQLPDGSASLRHGGPSVELSPSDGKRPAKH